MNPLTYWIVENALAQLARWQAHRADLTMGINLSVRNLLDRNCARRLEEIIRRAGVDPALVEFELTETAVMSDPEMAIAMLGRITATGARLTIDDFGTGYFSLAYLRRFPVHGIKIDRSFVAEVSRHEKSRAIVRSSVQLAGNLGLRVVAEGVEDGPTADTLLEMGCGFAQGYFFSLPEPADVIDRHLQQSMHLPIRPSGAFPRAS
jgi:EAL domain-containing protein (putative c-di-GMP-specific phosphodiesterase class I)